MLIHANSIYFNQFFVAHLDMCRYSWCGQGVPSLRIYAIDWNEPSLHISSFQDAVSIALRFPTAWAAETSEMVQRCEIWTSEHEICFAAEDFGWRETCQASTRSGRELWRQLVQVAKDLQNSGDQVAVQTITERWIRFRSWRIAVSVASTRWWVGLMPGHV